MEMYNIEKEFQLNKHTDIFLNTSKIEKNKTQIEGVKPSEKQINEFEDALKNTRRTSKIEKITQNDKNLLQEDHAKLSSEKIFSKQTEVNILSSDTAPNSPKLPGMKYSEEVNTDKLTKEIISDSSKIKTFFESKNINDINLSKEDTLNKVGNLYKNIESIASKTEQEILEINKSLIELVKSRKGDINSLKEVTVSSLNFQASQEIKTGSKNNIAADTDEAVRKREGIKSKFLSKLLSSEINNEDTISKNKIETANLIPKSKVSEKLFEMKMNALKSQKEQGSLQQKNQEALNNTFDKLKGEIKTLADNTLKKEEYSKYQEMLNSKKIDIKTEIVSKAKEEFNFRKGQLLESNIIKKQLEITNQNKEINEVISNNNLMKQNSFEAKMEVRLSSSSSKERVEKIIDQVSDYIKHKAKLPVSFFKITLEPSNLGKINVLLSGNQNSLNIKIASDNADTNSMFKREEALIKSKISSSLETLSSKVKVEVIDLSNLLRDLKITTEKLDNLYNTNENSNLNDDSNQKENDKKEEENDENKEENDENKEEENLF